MNKTCNCLCLGSRARWHHHDLPWQRPRHLRQDHHADLRQRGQSPGQAGRSQVRAILGRGLPCRIFWRCRRKLRAPPGVRNGVNNGLHLVLDAESYDYADRRTYVEMAEISTLFNQIGQNLSLLHTYSISCTFTRRDAPGQGVPRRAWLDS